jgi:hypothetical protein
MVDVIEICSNTIPVNCMVPFGITKQKAEQGVGIMELSRAPSGTLGVVGHDCCPSASKLVTVMVSCSK